MERLIFFKITIYYHIAMVMLQLQQRIAYHYPVFQQATQTYDIT